MDLFDFIRAGQFEMVMSGDRVLVSEYYSVLYDIYENEFTMYNARELEIMGYENCIVEYNGKLVDCINYIREIKEKRGENNHELIK